MYKHKYNLQSCACSRAGVVHFFNLSQVPYIPGLHVCIRNMPCAYAHDRVVAKWVMWAACFGACCPVGKSGGTAVYRPIEYGLYALSPFIPAGVSDTIRRIGSSASSVASWPWEQRWRDGRVWRLASVLFFFTISVTLFDAVLILCSSSTTFL